MTAPQPDRPEMDPSYGVGDPQYPFTPLQWDDVTGKLTESRNYWISTTRSSGRPHSVPVWGVWSDEAFWFFTGSESLTGKNLAGNPNAEVHLESGDDVVMLFGTFETVNATANVNGAYLDKYGLDDPGDDDTPALRLRLAKAIAWRESDFPNSATRWRF